MASFQEVMKQWRRMCEMSQCIKCPLSEICTTDPLSRTDVEIAKIEEAVSQWAEEHPEPVYPTWYEWLCSIGAWNKASDPIPADIAQKLGIEPKEG